MISRRKVVLGFSAEKPTFLRIGSSVSPATAALQFPITATKLNNLARIHGEQGDLAGARSLYERALATNEKAFGPEHLEVMVSLSRLAVLLHKQKDLEGARPLYEQALEINEKVLGPEHPDTALSLNNIASLLHDQGNFAAARPLYARALAINEKVLGSEHPDTATSLSQLALLLHDQNDLPSALPLLERALAIREQKLGPEHPDTATSLSNLAFLVHDQNNLLRARTLFERALTINEKVLGAEHPDTARSLHNLALLNCEDDLSGAQVLFERALAINEKALGPEHLDTARSLHDFAYTFDYYAPARAQEFYERALAIREKTLGPEHSDTLQSLIGLILTHQLQEHHSTAQSYSDRIILLLKSREEKKKISPGPGLERDLNPSIIPKPDPPGQIDDTSEAGGAAVGHVRQALSPDELALDRSLKADGIDDVNRRQRIIARWRSERSHQTARADQPIASKLASMRTRKERKAFLKQHYPIPPRTEWAKWIQTLEGDPAPSDFQKWADENFPDRVKLGLVFSDLKHLDKKAYDKVVNWRPQDIIPVGEFGFPRKEKRNDELLAAGGAPTGADVFDALRRGDPRAPELNRQNAMARKRQLQHPKR